MLTPQQAIIYLAAGAADPNCKKCRGRGHCGTVKRTYFPDEVLVCSCAVAGIPRLNNDPHHIKLPSEVRA